MAEAGRVESEAEIIGRYLAPLAKGFPGALGLADDCATLTPPPGRDLVLNTDSLIEGVHFLAGDVPAYKALAVNVSDLVAKGAEPLIYLLTLALTQAPERSWMTAFAADLARAQAAFGCHLAGGDTDRTPGNFTITIAAIGLVPSGRMVRRSTASPGDLVYVSGTIGDAGLGLRIARAPELSSSWGLHEADVRFLLARFREPSPRLMLAPVLRDCASACLDVSDGLVKDLGHLCQASRVGASIELAKVPMSGAARRLVSQGRASVEELVQSGEDYELLVAVPPQHAHEFEGRASAAGVAMTSIGLLVEPERGVTLRDESGHTVAAANGGWDHFAGAK